MVGDVHDLDKTPLEFLALQVKGQSFVLHQIRKMIGKLNDGLIVIWLSIILSVILLYKGFVVAIIRGYVKESEFDNAFLEDKMDIPRAPALGLILENVRKKLELVLKQKPVAQLPWFQLPWFQLP